MRGSSLLPVILAGVVPFFLFAVIVLGFGVQWIAWGPPLVWADRYGERGVPSAGSGATAVAVDKGSLYEAGFTNLTIVFYANLTARFPGLLGRSFLAKYDLSGHLDWRSTASLNLTDPDSVIPIAGLAPWSNDVYVATNRNGSSFIMKYDSAGHNVWSSRFVGTNYGLGGISAAATGIFAVGGGYFREYDFSGNLIWNDSLGGVLGVNASPLGIYVLTEDHLLRYDSNGAEVWTVALNCASCRGAESLSVDGTGIYVSERNGHVWKYAPDSSLMWEVQFQLPLSSDSAQDARLSADSTGVYIYLIPYFDRNDFLVKYDSNGRQLWSFAVSRDGYGWYHDSPYLSAGEGNLYLVSDEKGSALVEEFGPPSLIFLGINPPWSFVTLGGTLATIASGLTLTIRNSRKNMRRHPRRVHPVGVPAD